MSVLENFFRISMTLLIVSIGINLSIIAFGQTMTGQSISGIANTSFLEDVNTTISQGTSEATSQIRQSSTDIVSMAFSVVSNIWNGTYLNLFLAHAFGLQNLINYICTTNHIPSAISNIIITLLSAMQLFGAIYIVFIIFAAPKGGAGSL